MPNKLKPIHLDHIQWQLERGDNGSITLKGLVEEHLPIPVVDKHTRGAAMYLYEELKDRLIPEIRENNETGFMDLIEQPDSNKAPFIVFRDSRNIRFVQHLIGRDHPALVEQLGNADLGGVALKAMDKNSELISNAATAAPSLAAQLFNENTAWSLRGRNSADIIFRGAPPEESAKAFKALRRSLPPSAVKHMRHTNLHGFDKITISGEAAIIAVSRWAAGLPEDGLIRDLAQKRFPGAEAALAARGNGGLEERTVEPPAFGGSGWLFDSMGPFEAAGTFKERAVDERKKSGNRSLSRR